MKDVVAFVKKYYPKIEEIGLTINSTEFSVISGLKGFNEDGMLESEDEKWLLDFLFMFIQTPDALNMDFEGLGYEFFVKQVQELSGNEIVFEDAVTKIDPEVEESGQGTCEISFKCNGKPYSFTAVFNYDWFDPKFLTFLNSVLEDQKIEKRLMAFGSWNICMITLQTPAWMEKFKTLLPMDIEIF